MPCFVTQYPSEIIDVLFKYLSKEFSLWKIRKSGQHILLDPSECHSFSLNCFRKYDLFQIKVFHIEKFEKKVEVPFLEIKCQMYRFYFEFIVLSKIPNFEYTCKTLFTEAYVRLSTSDIFDYRTNLCIH